MADVEITKNSNSPIKDALLLHMQEWYGHVPDDEKNISISHDVPELKEILEQPPAGGTPFHSVPSNKAD